MVGRSRTSKAMGVGSIGVNAFGLFGGSINPSVHRFSAVWELVVLLEEALYDDLNPRREVKRYGSCCSVRLRFPPLIEGSFKTDVVVVYLLLRLSLAVSTGTLLKPGDVDHGAVPIYPFLVYVGYFSGPESESAPEENYKARFQAHFLG